MGTGTRLSARIFRYDPTTDASPRYDTIEMPFDPRLRVLDVLEYAVEDCGLGLGFRYFCGVKRCGLCGVNVNGKPVLACWEAATPSMVIEPLRNMRVIRDLTVDRSAFERATVELEPRLVRKTPYASFPEAMTHTAVHDSFRLMNCIECYVCSSACPAVPEPSQRDDAGHRRFVGPGTVVQLAKVALHPKDELDRGGLLEEAGIENCMSCYRCEEVCPVHIPIVTGAILPLRAIASKGPRQLARFPLDFAENVRVNVNIRSASLFLKTRGFTRALASLPMVLRMLVRRKTRLFAKESNSARRAIQAVFKAAGQEKAR
jgi:succinate dehydrogenase/fumarate reductase iron-sulfur protein